MDSAAKDEAVNSYVKLTDTIEKETDAETVLTAKGYTDCIVTVNDDTVDVTLPVANLSDTERAQVEDIVTRKTGYDVSQLVITIAEDKQEYTCWVYDINMMPYINDLLRFRLKAQRTAL